jgi:hypothetical protein
MARFKKGQTVYYASLNFGSYDRGVTRIAVVIGRVVDSCGMKRLTFVDRGNDSVYGRSTRADNQQYFETADDAIVYLVKNDTVNLYCPVVYCDAESRPFDDLRNKTMTLIEK